MKNIHFFFAFAVANLLVFALASCKKEPETLDIPTNEIVKGCAELFSIDSSGQNIGAFGVALTPAYLWQPGQTIRIKFLGGTPFVQAKIRQFAEQWLTHANVKYSWVNSGTAEVRISFTNTGSWSYVGKQALNVAQDKATMNFGWFDDNTPDAEFQRTTVHEFGHALGLKHEHQHPQNVIPWDKPAVYRYYAQTQGWSQTQTNEQVLNRYSASLTQFSAYCPSSIMHYPIPNQLTLGNFEVGWNSQLGQCDLDFIKTLYPFPNAPIQKEDEYFVGDWDGDGKSTLGNRRGNSILMNLNFDGTHDWLQNYGNGNNENQYLIGDWDGDGRSNAAVRLGNRVLMDYNFDGWHNRVQTYGNGNTEDQYLAGDWNGDGKDNIAVRRGNKIIMDFNFDGVADLVQTFGNGASEDEYLVGDWDGDGRDNIAVRRGNKVIMDFNFDGNADFVQSFGNGASENEYLVGDWNGDGKDNIGIRRNGNQFHLDTNFNGTADIVLNYGNGTK